MNEAELRKSRKLWRKRELAAQKAYKLAHERRVRRDRQLKKYNRDGVADGLAWGLKRVGMGERPPGSNNGPEIAVWGRNSIGVAGGFAWCQTFANAVLVAGGGQQLKSAYTVAVVQWAREGKFGLRVVRTSDRREGDFVYFKWPGVSRDFCDHVGVYLGKGKTLEGNTSPGTSGSQNDGGGVFIRTRGLGNVVAVVRPTYG
jgi:hypothetical protein